jgi:putative membrane protein
VCRLVAALVLAVAETLAQSPDPPPSRARTDDAEFVVGVAADLLMEVQLGRLAVLKATRADVRGLGQTIVETSGRSRAGLEAIAVQKKIELPVELRPEQKAKVAEIGALSGKAFDDAFLLSMEGERTRALDVYAREATSWGDPDVKAWAESALPALKRHLARVKELSQPAAAAAAPAP